MSGYVRQVFCFDTFGTVYGLIIFLQGSNGRLGMRLHDAAVRRCGVCCLNFYHPIVLLDPKFLKCIGTNHKS